MKKSITVVVISIAVYFSACSSAGIGRQYEFREPAGRVTSDIGYLVVTTDKMKVKEYSDDVEYEVYKGYTIYTSKGIFILDVPTADQSPARIKLKEGEYIIVAEMHKNVVQSFTVKIERGKIVEVDKNMIENLFPEFSERSSAR